MLSLGTAKMDITPPKGVEFNGYVTGNRSAGTWKNIYARALALDDGRTRLVLIATDQRLIFVQEKGLFGKSYRALESIEYREIANWKLGQTIRVRSLRVDVAQGRDRHKVFNNILEADPMTLNTLAPWTLDQVKQLLGRLKSAAP